MGMHMFQCYSHFIPPSPSPAVTTSLLYVCVSILAWQIDSLIKSDECESVELKWMMNLELVLQSEVSQKEKNEYHALTHIYGI